jgi:hypothetical protein
MHRTDLAGLEPGTAWVIVVRGDRTLTAERKRRGDNAGDLAREPDANDPRDAAANGEHDRSSA